MANRSPFPSINGFRAYVLQELNRRRKTFPTPIDGVFCRMTSTKSDPNYGYEFFSLGLHGFEPSDNSSRDIFNISYGKQDVVGYGYTNTVRGDFRQRVPLNALQSDNTKNGTTSAGTPLTSADGLHPVPGITKIIVKYLGPTEATRTDIHWTCYNATQLEFLGSHFLTPGSHAVVEFGHLFSDSSVNRTPSLYEYPRLKFEEQRILSDLQTAALGGKSFIVDKWGAPANGNYGVIVGIIGNIEVNITKNGGFECVTQLFSPAESIFGITTHLTNTNVDPVPVSGNTSSNNPLFFGPSSIHDFFMDNGVFDAIVDIYAQSNVDKVIDNQGATGHIFITWKYFWEIIIPSLLLFISYGSRPEIVNFFTSIKIGDEPLVGSTPHLKSCNPDILVIVRNFMKNQQVFLASSGGIGGASSRPINLNLFPFDNTFDNNSKTQQPGQDPSLAYLSNGVWMNCEAIKDAFLSGGNNFLDCLQYLLTRMNNAVSNYWNLTVNLDEENMLLKVFDKGTIYDATHPGGEPGSTFSRTPVYVFNDSHFSECFAASLQTTYTKEMMAQIMASSYNKTVDDPSVTGANAFSLPQTYTQFLKPSNIRDLLDDFITSNNVQTTSNSSTNNNKTNLTELATVVGHFVSGRSIKMRATQQAGVDPVAATLSNQGTAPQRDQSGIGIQDPSNVNVAQQNNQFVSQVTTGKYQQVVTTHQTKVENSTTATATEEASTDANIEQRELEISSKYGPQMQFYIELSPSNLSRTLLYDGIQGDKSNNYIAPVPTDIHLNMVINGIFGISLFDVFAFDKIPSWYNNNGVFLVTELEDEIDQAGWRTSIRGTYYYLGTNAKKFLKTVRASQ